MNPDVKPGFNDKDNYYLEIRDAWRQVFLLRWWYFLVRLDNINFGNIIQPRRISKIWNNSKCRINLKNDGLVIKKNRIYTKVTRVCQKSVRQRIAIAFYLMDEILHRLNFDTPPFG